MRRVLREIHAQDHALVATFLATVCCVALSGCSGADHEEITSVADKYRDAENSLSLPITQRQAECRAEVYLESDLSDGAMDDVWAGKQPAARNEDDVEVLLELADKLADCL